MSDGAIPVQVEDAAGRSRDTTVRAEGGKVILTNPDPGTAILDPYKGQVDMLLNAIDVATQQALRQPRQEP